MSLIPYDVREVPVIDFELLRDEHSINSRFGSGPSYPLYFLWHYMEGYAQTQAHGLFSDEVPAGFNHTSWRRVPMPEEICRRVH